MLEWIDTTASRRGADGRLVDVLSSPQPHTRGAPMPPMPGAEPPPSPGNSEPLGAAGGTGQKRQSAGPEDDVKIPMTL